MIEVILESIQMGEEKYGRDWNFHPFRINGKWRWVVFLSKPTKCNLRNQNEKWKKNKNREHNYIFPLKIVFFPPSNNRNIKIKIKINISKKNYYFFLYFFSFQPNKEKISLSLLYPFYPIFLHSTFISSI